MLPLTRRRFIQLGAAAAVSTLALGGYGFLRSRLVAAEHVHFTLDRLPPAFDGFRLAQLSDLHYGFWSGATLLQQALEEVQRFAPDLVVLTGDQLHHDRLGTTTSEEQAEQCAATIAALKLPVVAVMGNHDYRFPRDFGATVLSDQGIIVLRNSALPLERQGSRLWIAGGDDAWYDRLDLQKTLQKVPSGEATVLLMHEPDVAPEVARHAVDLQLSGHSHGGQVSLPLLGPLITPRLGSRFVRGHYRVGGLQLYTNRGLGVIPPPVRINCPPEVTLITLHMRR